MKSKTSFRQQSRPVMRILNVTFTTVAIMLALSGSALAQGRLPFVGTRTFCGEHSYQLSGTRDNDPKLKWETKTTVTIRATGFTTVKTNAYGSHYGEKNEGSPSPYLTFSGKLTAGKKGEMHDTAMGVCMTSEPFCLSFLSTTRIIIDTENSADEGELCTSEAAAPKKSNDIQRTSADAGNARSNSTLGVRPQSTSTQQIAPDTLVANLYRQNEKVFQPRSRALLDKYFDKSLADLIWKALLRWESSGSEEDFDYVLYNFGVGGDVSSVSKPVIGKPTYEAQKAQVNVSYVVVCAPPVCAKKSVHKETIIFLLAAGKTGWKITDIHYNGEIKSLFEEYSKEFKETGELRPRRTTARTPVLPGPTSSVSTQTYIQVSLKGVKDLRGLGRSFPFLKGELDEVITDNTNPASGLGPTNVYVSDLNQKGLPRLIFIAMDGRYCGSHGCSLTVFMDQGKGFGHVLDALVDVESPIYISKDQLSLLTCGGRGRGEWRFENNAFEATAGDPRPSQKLAPCGTHAITAIADADNPVTATARPPGQTPTSEPGDVVNETRVDPAAAELSYWKSIRNSTDPEDYKAYLDKYPNGQFAELAKLRAKRLRAASNSAPSDVTAAERARNTRVFEVRDASKTSGWLTVVPGSITFEPKKSKEGKSITIQCSEIKHIEQGQSAVASPHVNLFLNGKEGTLVFYTSSGGTGVVGVFVKGIPAKPVVDITANVINAITEACR